METRRPARRGRHFAPHPCAAGCGPATRWRSTRRSAAVAARRSGRPRRPCLHAPRRALLESGHAGKEYLRRSPIWTAPPICARIRRGSPHALADERSRVIPVWNSRNLIEQGDTPRAAYLELSHLPAERHNSTDLILLGRFRRHQFLHLRNRVHRAAAAAPGTRFEDLRLVASVLPIDEAGLLGYARAIVSWRQRHRFCGTCGAKTVAARSGHVVVCSDPGCRTEQFPRIDPAIIVLVSDGERALLGRQASWPIGRYSTIAGFVEPGGIPRGCRCARGARGNRHRSRTASNITPPQPWPFPASLMLGFTAHAVTSEVHLRDQELEDARWFTRAEIASSTAAVLPPRQSISFRLIEQWFDAGGDQHFTRHSWGHTLAIPIDGSVAAPGVRPLRGAVRRVRGCHRRRRRFDSIAGAARGAILRAHRRCFWAPTSSAASAAPRGAVLRYMRVVRVPWRLLLARRRRRLRRGGRPAQAW